MTNEENVRYVTSRVGSLHELATQLAGELEHAGSGLTEAELRTSLLEAWSTARSVEGRLRILLERMEMS